MAQRRTALVTERPSTSARNISPRSSLFLSALFRHRRTEALPAAHGARPRSKPGRQSIICLVSRCVSWSNRPKGMTRDGNLTHAPRRPGLCAVPARQGNGQDPSRPSNPRNLEFLPYAPWGIDGRGARGGLLGCLIRSLPVRPPSRSPLGVPCLRPRVASARVYQSWSPAVRVLAVSSPLCHLVPLGQSMDQHTGRSEAVANAITTASASVTATSTLTTPRELGAMTATGS